MSNLTKEAVAELREITAHLYAAASKRDSMAAAIEWENLNTWIAEQTSNTEGNAK